MSREHAYSPRKALPHTDLALFVGSLPGAVALLRLNLNLMLILNLMLYDEQVLLLKDNAHVDYKAVSKHLGGDPLKMQGGDIARNVQQQLGERRLTRALLYLDFLALLRRELTASDINVPGGFRREYLIHRLVQDRRPPPSFVARNFVEFLAMYGHFAGEDFSDDDDETASEDEAVFDEELLLAAERGVPVMPRKKRRPQAAAGGLASQLKTFFLLFKALVGLGVLFLPRAFCNGGLLFSTVAMAAFGVLTYACYVVLIHSKDALGKALFGELGYTTYGRPLQYLIMVLIILSQIGFVATYILFTAENMALFLAGVGLPVSHAALVVGQCMLLIPLTLIRDLTKLSVTSLTLSLFILVGLVIIFYFAGVQLWEHGPGPNIVAFSSTWSMLIGVAVTSFEGIGLILPIEAAMARPERFPRVLLLSMAAITALFVAIGVVGYLAYGENVRLIIILNLPQQNPAVQLILVLYSCAVFLTGPLQLFPAIRIGELVFFNSRLFVPNHARTSNEGRLYRTLGKYNPHIKWMKNLFRALVVVGISLVAYANANNIDKFVSFNGCFACIPLVYVYPPMIHLKTRASRWLHAFDYGLIVVGITAVVYTTYQILFAIE